MKYFINSENSKGVHVSHHGLEDNGKSFDYFDNKTTFEPSKPLLATVIMYLSNVNRGGQILFPESEVRRNCLQA